MNQSPPRLSESEKKNFLFKAHNGFRRASSLLGLESTAHDRQMAQAAARRALAALSRLCEDSGKDLPPKPRRLAQQRLRPVMSLRRKIGGAA